MVITFFYNISRRIRWISKKCGRLNKNTNAVWSHFPRQFLCLLQFFSSILMPDIVLVQNQVKLKLLCLTTFATWWRHQMETFSALLALCAGNSPVPVNSPHKGQWRGALMFSFIYAWINDWANNREAGDLRRQDGHYDIIVMKVFKKLYCHSYIFIIAK